MAFNEMETKVIDLFIAAYGRAPTQKGLGFFVDKLMSGDMTEDDIVAYMFDTANNPEAATRYPDGMSPEDTINTIFQHVLGREVATTEGMNYWKDVLAQEGIAKTVAKILDVARGDEANYLDAEVLENKRDIVEHFLNKIPADKQDGMQVPTDSILNDTDVQEAKDAIDLIAENGSTTQVLKESANEELKGTIFNDVFDAITNKDSLNISSFDPYNGDKIVDKYTTDSDTLEAFLENNLGSKDDGTNSDPNDGPTIENIETITFRDDGTSVDVYNVGHIKGTNELRIDNAQSTLFTSPDDVATLEIRNAWGDQIKNVVAIDNTKALYLTEVANDLNVILKEDVKSLRMEARDDSDQHKASVELKGASISLGLADDNDTSALNNGHENDGASFAELTLISSEKASVITLASDTSLANAVGQDKDINTDNVNGSTDTANAAAVVGDLKDVDTGYVEANSFTTSQLHSGVDTIGDETEANDLTNLGLADHLILDGDQDITIKGTAAQFDEAYITETDDEKMTSTLELNILAAEDGSSIDLTAAEVDRVVVTSEATNVAEIDVDVDTVVRVNAIADDSSLIVTGDNSQDVLDIEINVGNANAALGTLILGGDAHANTTDFDGEDTSAGGPEGQGSNKVLDTDVVDAKTAIINVISNSNLNALDISQLTSKTVKIIGSEDLTIGTLVMGGGDQGDAASILDARDYTGDFKADLVVGSNTGYDDAGGVDGDADFGNRIYLGSGNDVLGNVGVVDTTSDDHSDDIHMGAGQDVVEIGTISEDSNKHLDNATSAEIYGGEGKDTFVFQSDASTQLADNSSSIWIKDFDAGSGGDQISMHWLRDRDGEGSSKPDFAANLSLYRNGEIISDTPVSDGAHADFVDGQTEYELQDGNIVFISTADITTFNEDSVKALFGDSATSGDPVGGVFDGENYESGSNSEWDEFTFIVGETSGNDGVKIYSVVINGTDNTASANSIQGSLTVNLIGQLTNENEDINITTITDDNIDLL